MTSTTLKTVIFPAPNRQYDGKGQRSRGKKYVNKLPNISGTGTVIKAFDESQNCCELNTLYNAFSLMVKLDKPIDSEEIVIVETESKKLADLLTTPKEGSKISFDGRYIARTTKYSRTKRKFAIIKAFKIFNNEPKAPISKHLLNPVFKLGLKIANNDIIKNDVFAVVYQPVDGVAKLIDVIAAKNRSEACKAFENNPRHKPCIQMVHDKEPNYSKVEPDNHLFSIRLYRMDFKKPVIHWNDFGNYFNELSEKWMQ